MAKEKTAAEETKATVEEVEVFVPRGNRNDEATEFVSINGRNFYIPKGKTSKVPKFVADELERAEHAKRRLDRKMDDLAANSKKI